MKQPIKKKLVEQGVAKAPEEQILTLVIDGNSVLKQSLVDDTVGTNGKEYGAIMQTFIILKRLISLRDWNFVYMVFDGDNSGQLRYDFYPEYKQNRDKNFKDKNFIQTDYNRQINDYCKRVIEYSRKKRQFSEEQRKRRETDEERFQNQRELMIEMCDCLCIRTLMYDNVEGDDIIAYLVKNKQDNEKVCIVSNDRDLTQLISEDVCIYIPQKKDMVTHLNSVEKLGYTYKNVVIYKMLCGDSSDNIKGITGMGKETFFKYYPKAINEEVDLAYIFERSGAINAERVEHKQKPLKVLENVLKCVSSGCQGTDVYKINERLIDLRKYILLTREAEEDLKNVVGAPLDPEGRDFKELYKIVLNNGMSKLLAENSFGSFFSCFGRLVENEKQYYEKSLIE